jgi:hypothetical protein
MPPPPPPPEISEISERYAPKLGSAAAVSGAPFASPRLIIRWFDADDASMLALPSAIIVLFADAVVKCGGRGAAFASTAVCDAVPNSVSSAASDADDSDDDGADGNGANECDDNDKEAYEEGKEEGNEAEEEDEDEEEVESHSTTPSADRRTAESGGGYGASGGSGAARCVCGGPC